MMAADVGLACTRIDRAGRLPDGKLVARCDGRMWLLWRVRGYSVPGAIPCDRAPQFGLSCRRPPARAASR